MFKVSEYWISVDVGSSRQAVQDGWFEEDNPVELLCWARDKDYYTVLARVQQVMMWAVDARPLVAGLLARAGARFQVLVLRGGRGRAAPSRCLAGPLGEAGLELLRLQGRVRLLLEVDLRASLLGRNALVNLYVWIPTC